MESAREATAMAEAAAAAAEEEDTPWDGWRAGEVPRIYVDERQGAILPYIKDCDRKARTGKALFKQLLHPCTVDEFEKTHFQKQALLVKRSHHDDDGDGAEFYSSYFTEASLRELLRSKGGLPFMESITLNKIVKTGKKGKRVRRNMNSNLDGTTEVAKEEDVWRRFNDDGCSMRVLHPQRHNAKLLRMIVALEEHFECLVGCNLYYTPPGSQGFAAHYDDVDVFVLQVKGKKTWSLFSSRNEQEVLPLFSSGDFDEEELGKPCEVDLGPGDLLYLPRGAIHRARTDKAGSSLHLTISANHLNTWANLLEDALPEALREATESCPEMRMTPPRGYFRYAGCVNSDQDGAERQRFLQIAEGLCSVVMQHVTAAVGGQETPMDHAADAMNARFQAARAFPLFGKSAAASSGRQQAAEPLEDGSELRLRKSGCARLMVSGDRAVLHHCFNNSASDHASGEERPWANDPKRDARLEFQIDDAPLLEEITKCVKAKRVDAFPCEEGEEDVRREVLTAAVQAGILEVVGGEAEAEAQEGSAKKKQRKK